MKTNNKNATFPGSIHFSNNCGKMMVTEYINATNVTVMFYDTKNFVKTTSRNVVSGSVMDPMSKSINGVGFIGTGRHKVFVNGSVNVIYRTWYDMIRRCYDEYELSRNPTYSDCSVCHEWHNFQSFAEWYEENHPKDGERYQIDKDLKVIGNRVYSPDTCMFVPCIVNVFIVCKTKKESNLPVGVVNNNSTGKYVASCSNPFTGKKDYLGLFSCKIEAHKAWRKRKSELTSELISMQKLDCVINGLINYKHAIDNNIIHVYSES